MIGVQNPLTSAGSRMMYATDGKRVIDCPIQVQVVVVGHSYGEVVMHRRGGGRAQRQGARFTWPPVAPGCRFLGYRPAQFRKSTPPTSARQLDAGRRRLMRYIRPGKQISRPSSVRTCRSEEARVTGLPRRSHVALARPSAQPFRATAWKTIPSWYLVSQEKDRIDHQLRHLDEPVDAGKFVRMGARTPRRSRQATSPFISRMSRKRSHPFDYRSSGGCR